MLALLINPGWPLSSGRGGDPGFTSVCSSLHRSDRPDQQPAAGEDEEEVQRGQDAESPVAPGSNTDTRENTHRRFLLVRQMLTSDLTTR